MSYCIEPHRPVGPDLQRIALEQLDRAGVLQDDASLTPAKRVHEVRKSMKKLRALMRLLGKNKDQRRIRDIARKLSSSRDAAVIASTFDELAEPGTYEELRALFHKRAAKVASKDEPAPDVHGPLRDSRNRVARWNVGQYDFYDLVRACTETYRQGRKGFRKARKDPTPLAIHDWRKRVKDHWYHMRLMADICPRIAPPRRDGLDEMGDLLGLSNDCVVLRDAVFKEDPKSGILARIDGRRDDLVREALARGKVLYASKPKEFARSLLKGQLG